MPDQNAWTQIPLPGLLTDMDRVDVGNRDPERSGDAGPVHAMPSQHGDDDVAAYARQLWRALDHAAQYLAEQVARGPSGPLLVTEEQWQQWGDVYAGVLSVLSGPAGDEGYGEDQARLEYQNGYLYREGHE